MSKQVIEPYTFQCKTNIEEHNDMVNKINEIVDIVNEMDVEEITKDITALESEVSAQGNEIDAINTEIAELPTKTEVSNGDITAVAVDKTSAGIEIQLTRPAGVLEDSVSLPFINTATLIPTSTERAFKIRFTYTDGTQYDTNEFVIPEGGGTDVSVTGVTVEDGTAPNSFKVAIQLSDASTIASNDYEIDIPAQQNTYPTSVSGTLSGTTLNLTIALNNSTNVTGTADLSAFLTKSEASTTYATKTEVTAVDTKVDAIGVTSEGNNVTVNGSNATIVKSVSGQVTDGNLKITVNGVESGDIPLPDILYLPTIKYSGGVYTDSARPFLIGVGIVEITTQNATPTDPLIYTYNYERIYLDSSLPEYYSSLSDNKIKCTANSRTTLNISVIGGLQEQVLTISNIVITEDKKFTCNIADGTYKIPINCLNTGSSTAIMQRKFGTTIPDNEYLTFTVSNNIATISPISITLNPENFVANRDDYTLSYVAMCADNIIKVS